MGAISPLPTCNATPGALCTTVSPVVAHWTGTPDVRELPEARQMQSGPLMSPTAVGLECSTTRVPRRVVTAGQPTGHSLPPCDEPSTPGCGSSVVTTPEHRHTVFHEYLAGIIFSEFVILEISRVFNLAIPKNRAG